MSREFFCPKRFQLMLENIETQNSVNNTGIEFQVNRSTTAKHWWL